MTSVLGRLDFAVDLIWKILPTQVEVFIKGVTLHKVYVSFMLLFPKIQYYVIFNQALKKDLISYPRLK